MKMLSLVFFISMITQSVYSMPCDTGYSCISKTGIYKIELQRCRYRNHLNYLSTKINNIEVSGASLNVGWDSDTFIAFEINLPSNPDGSVKILTSEISKQTKKGNIKIKFAESGPGPLTTLQTENIHCMITE